MFVCNTHCIGCLYLVQRILSHIIEMYLYYFEHTNIGLAARIFSRIYFRDCPELKHVNCGMKVCCPRISSLLQAIK